MRSLFVLKSELKDRINLKLLQLLHAVRTFFLCSHYHFSGITLNSV